MPLHFAYGANLDVAATAARCTGARVVCPARLPMHRLGVLSSGYLTVERDPRRSVHGLLWEVPFAAIPALDRFEEVTAGLYRKLHHVVIVAGGTRRALLYVGTNVGPGRAPAGYLAAVRAAAEAADLPAAALAALADLGGSPAPDRPKVTPRRHSPLDAEPNRNAGWRWTP